MNAKKLNDWYTRMDAVTSSFRDLGRHDFNTKLNEVTWSIAQVLDHLVRINRSYYATFDAVKDGLNTVHIHGKFGFLNRAVGKMILKSVEPGRRRKIKTQPIWEPQKSDIPNDILDTFQDEQDEMKLWMKHLSLIEDVHQPIASPANKAIIYPLSTAFEIIVTHEERHLEQAKEIAASLASHNS